MGRNATARGGPLLAQKRTFDQTGMCQKSQKQRSRPTRSLPHLPSPKPDGKQRGLEIPLFAIVAHTDARTNSLNTSEQALFERGEACLSSDQTERAIAFDGVGKENAGAHQTQNCCNRIDHHRFHCAHVGQRLLPR